MKKTISSLFLTSFAAISLMGATEYKQVSTKAKIQEPGLLFVATFDGHRTNADMAKGNPESSHPDASLLLRGQLGFDGRQAYRPTADEQPTFDLIKNLNPNRGSMSMWFRCDDFEPTDKTVKNAGIFEFSIRNGSREIRNFAYIYAGTLCMNVFPFNNGKHSRGGGAVETSLKGFKKGEWIQLCVTWDKHNYTYFVNGKQIGNPVAAPYVNAPEPGSYLAFSCEVWNVQRKKIFSLDDIKIFDYTMSPGQVKARYQGLLANPGEIKQELQINYSGIDNGTGKVPTLVLELDAREVITDVTNAQWKISGAINKKGSTSLKYGMAEIQLEAPLKGGKCTVDLQVGKFKKTSVITIPDFSFIKEDNSDLNVVVSPWTEPVLHNDRSITVWNRKYKFGEGPFPTQAWSGKTKLLTAPPALTLNGKPIVWKAGSTEKTDKLGIDLTGSGTCGQFKINYRTRVEFDGMVRCNFTLSGKGEVKEFLLNWQASEPIRQFLMIPTYVHNNKKLTMGYRGKGYMVWQVSEKKAGFFWMPESDANCVFANPGQAIQVDVPTGKCRVELISQKVQINGDYPYTMYFAATPTRPVWEKHPTRFTSTICTVERNGLDGSPLKPIEPMMEKYCKPYPKASLIPYSMGHGLDVSSPVANYLRKSWSIPGMHVYNMRNVPIYDESKQEYTYKKLNPSIPICPANSNYTAYRVSNIRKLLNHKYADRLQMLYFDLSSVIYCQNEHHGCGYTDKFGRKVGTRNLMAMREMYRQIITLAHQHNVPVMLHAQASFTPVSDGLADIWFPGEQFESINGRKPATGIMAVPFQLFRTEINRDILGCNVQYTPVVPGHLLKKSQFKHGAEAVLAITMLHDINIDRMNTQMEVVERYYGIMEHYGLYKPGVKVHKYFEPDHPVTMSNKKLFATLYSFPDNYKLLVIVNRENKSLTTDVDITGTGVKTSSVLEEYTNISYPVKNNKFQITVKPCNFVLVALPPKPWYPFKDEFNRPWMLYQYEQIMHGNTLMMRDADHDQGVFRSAPTSMAIRIRPKYFVAFADYLMPKEWKLSNIRIIPVTAGKTYEAEIWCKTAKLPPKAKVRFNVRIVDGSLNTITRNTSVSHTRPNSDWERMTVSWKVPANGKFVKLELEAPGAQDALVCFDDLTIKEK